MDRAAEDKFQLRLLNALDDRLTVDGSVKDCCRESAHGAADPLTPIEPNNTKLEVVICPTHNNPPSNPPIIGIEPRIRSKARPAGLIIANWDNNIGNDEAAEVSSEEAEDNSNGPAKLKVGEEITDKGLELERGTPISEE